MKKANLPLFSSSVLLSLAFAILSFAIAVVDFAIKPPELSLVEEVHQLFPDDLQEKKKLRNKNTPDLPESEAVYLSDVSSKDKAWDKHRSNSEIIEEMYLELGYERYPDRINDCSRLLEFVLKQDSNQEFLFKLQGAKFCRVRFCPVCQWRKSLMWRGRFYKAVPAIKADYPTFQFLFLTLTVKNCKVNNLRETIEAMHYAWRKLVSRKAFPARGWVRSTEITKDKNNLAHPHFHCILIVPSNYFKGKGYLSKDKWINMWQQSLKVDYKPSIDIKKVKLTKGRKKKISERLGKELTENDIVFYGLMECLKYSVKEFDLMSDPEWLDAVTKQLYKTRAIATGGLFKQYLSEDVPEDLINVELEQDIEILETDAKFLFGWKEKVKRYQSM